MARCPATRQCSQVVYNFSVTWGSFLKDPELESAKRMAHGMDLRPLAMVSYYTSDIYIILISFLSSWGLTNSLV